MLTATIENVLNRGLPRSPRAQQLCAELAGRRIAIEAPAMARLLVESTGNSLRITRGNLPADAEVIGGPLSLLALGGSAADAPLSRGEVVVRGDAELAQKFRELARLLRPDPEEELSLAEIGRRLGVSRERARQLEARAKKKLRDRLQPLAA